MRNPSGGDGRDTTGKAVVWHPDIHSHYFRKLYFVTITTDAYDDKVYEKLRDSFPNFSLYPVYGNADIVLRGWATETELKALFDYVRNKNLGRKSYFEVERVFRTWGHPVDGALGEEGITSIDAPMLKRVATAWPNLDGADAPHGHLILGARNIQDTNTSVRAFTTIHLTRFSQDSVDRVIGSIGEASDLTVAVHGIYAGFPREDFVGHLVLEICVSEFGAVRGVVEAIYDHAHPLPMKTSTFIAAGLNEAIEDGASFSDTHEVLLKSYKRKFPLFETLGVTGFEKMAIVEPLRSFWTAPSPIGEWATNASAAIMEDDDAGLMTVVTSIAKIVERRLKAVVMPWLHKRFGSTKGWAQRAMDDLRLETTPDKPTLGQLAVIIRNADGAVSLPDGLRLDAIRQLTELRNHLVHDQEPTSTGDAGGIIDAFRDAPQVLSKLFREASPAFRRE